MDRSYKKWSWIIFINFIITIELLFSLNGIKKKIHTTWLQNSEASFWQRTVIQQLKVQLAFSYFCIYKSNQLGLKKNSFDSRNFGFWGKKTIEKRTCTVRPPVFSRHQFFETPRSISEKPLWSLLSGWMNYNYTAYCWFSTSSNILIVPSQYYWQIGFESCWLHCSKCRILVLLLY